MFGWASNHPPPTPLTSPATTTPRPRRPITAPRPNLSSPQRRPRHRDPRREADDRQCRPAPSAQSVSDASRWQGGRAPRRSDPAHHRTRVREYFRQPMTTARPGEARPRQPVAEPRASHRLQQRLRRTLRRPSAEDKASNVSSSSASTASPTRGSAGSDARAGSGPRSTPTSTSSTADRNCHTSARSFICISIAARSGRFPHPARVCAAGRPVQVGAMDPTGTVRAISWWLWTRATFSARSCARWAFGPIHP